MMSLRSKFRANRARISSQWRCCFCCHVHTATIFFGMWNLLLQIMALSAFAVLMRSPRLRFEAEPVLPTPQSKIEGFELDADFRLDSKRDNHPTPRMLPSLPQELERQDLAAAVNAEIINKAAIVVLFTLAITLLMVYGAVKGKPSYLKPFFYLQVLDFCICSVKAVDYICFLPDIHESFMRNPEFPFHDWIEYMDPPVVAFIVLVIFLVGMGLKGYFIGVIWSCYKYLKLRQVRAQCHIHYIDRMTSQSLLNDPPDYETAVKKFPAPPPSYEVATAMALDGAVQVESGLSQAIAGPSGLQTSVIVSGPPPDKAAGLVVALPTAVPSTSTTNPHSPERVPRQSTPPPTPAPPFPSAVPTALIAVTGTSLHPNDASAV